VATVLCYCMHHAAVVTAADFVADDGGPRWTTLHPAATVLHILESADVWQWH